MFDQSRVPVLAPDGETLTPCRPARARQMIDEGDATPFHDQGVFCIRLRREPSGRETSYTACGVDPGSKAEGFTVKSTEGTHLNVQTEARSGISKKLKKRKKHRRERRKSSPYREPDKHENRKIGAHLPPSTEARWNWKLKICEWLSGLYPIDVFVVEDPTPPKEIAYNPLKRGKEYFYNELGKVADVRVVHPEKMAAWRDNINLDKSNSNKTRVAFFKHCVDSWMLAWLETNCPFNSDPDYRGLISIQPVDIQRRVFPEGDSERQTEFPLKRRALVKHEEHGLCYIGDHPECPPYAALRSFANGELISKDIVADQCKFLTYINWIGCPSE